MLFLGWMEGGAARAWEGCCRMDMRSSTRREEASGATPGRVTVHCWSRVALLRDCFIGVSGVNLEVWDKGTYICGRNDVVAEVTS